MGESVTTTCLKFLNGRSELGVLNHTLLALIPKVKEPKKVNDFRPVNLCNVIIR